MKPIFFRGLWTWGIISLFNCTNLGAASPSAEQQQFLTKAHRFERQGWIYLHLEGDGRARGFQQGYLLSAEIAEGLRATRVSWEYSSGMPWSWLVDQAGALFASHIDAENLAELDGLAEGLQATGRVVTRNELIAYNGIIELSSYWWPIEMKKLKDSPPPYVREGCSAFIATGHLTRDGNIVLGHNTMMEYQEPFPNVIADIVPAHGHRILWQSVAGWIHSGMDFFITDAGLVGAETTIGSFEGFETNGVPEFIRMRRATQDAGNIDEWCAIMRQGNNGGYANAWLLGDTHSGEIARLELGKVRVAYEKKKDGCFTGSNVAEDLRLLRFETNARETDIRVSSVSRRVRWEKLMRQYAGKIDLSLAKDLEADHYDEFLEKVRAGSRSLCGHFELDRDPVPGWPGVPYGCAGTVDAKVVDAAMAQKMSFAARWGAACGRAFDAQQYLTAHPQFDWMRSILKSRPSQPWTQFKAGE